MKAVVITLGCKTNQYETRAVMKRLEEAGYEVSEKSEAADLYIINTCAVTAEAEKKSRQASRHLTTFNQSADVIIMGCASQNSVSKFLNLPNIVAVGGISGKVELIDRYLQGERNFSILNVVKNFEEVKPLQNRTRSYIKVQDGCNKNCTYCIVPLLRGKSRSRDINNILSEIAECNAKEIILGGIDLSDYRFEGLGLVDLVRRVGKFGGRVRLSSISVKNVNKELLIAMKEGNFCTHFHLSVQSGSDEVLKKMNRHYNSQDIVNACSLIREFYPRAGITCDIIAGFPEESQQNHLETLQTLEAADMAYMHIFPFSAREGTHAAEMIQISKEIKRQRVKDLENLREKLFTKFLAQELGKTEEIITEQTEDDYISGHTGNYIKVYLSSDVPRDSLIKIKIGERFRDGVKGIVY